MAASTGTNALWKKFYDYKITEYKAAYDAYIAKLGESAGWAAFETKGKPERKRVADVALWTKEQVKAKAAADAFKSATLDGATSNESSTKGVKNTAYGKITDIAYYGFVNTETSTKADMDTAAAN